MRAMHLRAAPKASGLRAAVGRAAAATATVLALLASPPSARADVNDACVPAYEATQVARKAGRLIEARRSAVTCSQPACPGAMVSECLDWLREIDRALPTVVLAFERPDGGDAIGARVTIDGALSDAVGRALPLDPGPHVVRVELAGFEPLEQRFLLQEGEQRRRITGKLTPRAEPPSRWPALVFAGVSALAFGGTIAFGAAAVADFNDLSARCEPTCPSADVSRVRREAVAADIALGVGVASLAAAAFFFFRAAPSTTVTVGATPTGGALRFERAF